MSKVDKKEFAKIAKALEPAIAFIKRASEQYEADHGSDVQKKASALAEKLITEGLLSETYRDNFIDQQVTSKTANFRLVDTLMEKYSRLRDETANNLGIAVRKEAREANKPKSRVVWERSFGSGRIS